MGSQPLLGAPRSSSLLFTSSSLQQTPATSPVTDHAQVFGRLHSPPVDSSCLCSSHSDLAFNRHGCRAESNMRAGDRPLLVGEVLHDA
jgi:hypothetical protein